MENNYQGIVDLKECLSEALITRLHETNDLSVISLDQLSADINKDAYLVRSVFRDVNELFLYWFNARISEIFVSLTAEFSKDFEATTREKVLETLMSILEAFADKRYIFQRIHKWALRDFQFGISITISAYHLCDMILTISGDKKKDLPIAVARRSMRIKGLIGLLLKTSLVWFKDDSDGLATTFREVDNNLSQAIEIAESFKLFEGSRYE